MNIKNEDITEPLYPLKPTPVERRIQYQLEILISYQ